MKRSRLLQLLFIGMLSAGILFLQGYSDNIPNRRPVTASKTNASDGHALPKVTSDDRISHDPKGIQETVGYGSGFRAETTEPESMQIGMKHNCDVTHAGDLILQGNESMAIVGEHYCQQGNIIVKDEASLRLSNAELIFQGSSDRYFRVQDNATLQTLKSRVTSERLTDVTFDDESSVLLEESELEWFHCHDSANVEIQDSAIYHFHPHHSCTVIANNSEISNVGLMLDTPNAHYRLSNINPDSFEYWDWRAEHPSMDIHYDITLSGTTVGSFSVGNNEGAVSASIVNSSLQTISCYRGWHYSLSETNVERLTFEEYIGDIQFDQSSIRSAISIQDSLLRMSGNLEIGDVSVELASSTVIREYLILTRDSDGDSLPNVLLHVTDPTGKPVWTGRSGSEGKAIIELRFNDLNYQDEWMLKATLPDGETISRPLGLLTGTPIEITPVRHASGLPHTLLVGTIRKPVSLDPHIQSSIVDPLAEAMDVVPSVYEALVYFDGEKTHRFVPSLAMEVPSLENDLITVEEDGRMTYTFPIRQGVRFHNRDLLTPTDIAYSLLRWALQGGKEASTFVMAVTEAGSVDELAGELGAIEACKRLQDAIEVQDDQVLVRTQRPYSTLLNPLTDAWIINKSWMAAQGGWDGDCQTWVDYRISSPDASPISGVANGTGPFVLEHWRPEGVTLLEKNENYWGKAPRLNQIILRKAQDWDQLMQMLIDGEIDLIGNYRPWPYPEPHTESPSSVPSEIGETEIHAGLPNSSLEGLFFVQSVNVEGGNPNIGNGQLGEEGIPPNFFSDVDVRKGFLFAFDYAHYLQEASVGLAEQPTGPIPRGLFGYRPDPEWRTYHYNPEKAEEHFQKAWDGDVWAKGFRATVSYNEGNGARKSAAELLKENIEALNPRFHVKIHPVRWSTYIGSFLAAREPVCLVGLRIQDPNGVVYRLMHSQQQFALAQRLENPGYDHLVEEAMQTFNEDRLQMIYDELQRLAYQDAIHGLYMQPNAVHIQQPWVRGWLYNPALPSLNLRSIWKVQP